MNISWKVIMANQWRIFSRTSCQIFWKFAWASKRLTIFTLKNENLKKKLSNEPSLHEIKKYVIHIRKLQQALNHGLFFKKAIMFKQKAWLKSYIDMNTDLRKATENDFKKTF